MTRADAFVALAYGGDVTRSLVPARPYEAAALLAADPGLAADPDVAWATGGQGAGPTRLGLPPLLAVTHSALLRLPAFRSALHASARRLLLEGADPNVRLRHLSPLYGAAGVNRDLDLAALLLDAGASPYDGESLYHSLEAPEVTSLLLDRGASIAGSNALFRALDMLTPDALRLLLARGADPNEVIAAGPVRHWRTPLLRALALRKPAPFVAALLETGADPLAETEDGRCAAVLAALTGHPAADRLPSPRPLDAAERFVAACVAGAACGPCPDLPPGLLRLLPDTAAWGDPVAVCRMVESGWPIAARGGDWDASALNHAVLRGDARLARLLLEHGADWRERHGHGDDALGTLAWASLCADGQGDWPSCAEWLVRFGMPAADGPDPDRPGWLRIAGRSARFSAAVAAVLSAAPGPRSASG